MIVRHVARRAPLLSLSPLFRSSPSPFAVPAPLSLSALGMRPAPRALHSSASSARSATSAPESGARGVPAAFYRGGTSKALVFADDDLPAGPGSRAARDALFLAAMGSPDPSGRQLDGMGGGYSSVSKVVVVGRSRDPAADVDYTFAQVRIDEPVVDYAGNCGNMLAAVGPFALERGLVAPRPTARGNLVRILNTNTGKVVHALFPAAGGRPQLGGGFAIAGVAGTHARVALQFLAPHGARTGALLPTGRALDVLALPGGEAVAASLVDCANPCAFVLASDVGLAGTEAPADFTGGVLARLAAVRNAAAVAMGLARSTAEADAARSVPKVVIVSAPAEDHAVLGGVVRAGDAHVVARCISAGDPHRALPITAALCTAAAAQVPGTLVRRVAREKASSDEFVIAHASGTLAVDAHVEHRPGPGGGGGEWAVPTASVFRTARKLFEGTVFVGA